MVRPLLDKTPYELLNGRKPNVAHLRTFGCKCFVHNNGKDNLGKLNPRNDEGTFVGYSQHSKAYKVFNKRTRKVEESVHVVFDENTMGGSSIEDDDEGDQGFQLCDEEVVRFVETVQNTNVINSEQVDDANDSDMPPLEEAANDNDENLEETVPNESDEPQDNVNSESEELRESEVVDLTQFQLHYQQKDAHPVTNIISDFSKGVQTRSSLQNFCAFNAFLYMMEPKTVDQALKDLDWVSAMQEELYQFERNKVWHLVP